MRMASHFGEIFLKAFEEDILGEINFPMKANGSAYKLGCIMRRINFPWYRIHFETLGQNYHDVRWPVYDKEQLKNVFKPQHFSLYIWPRKCSDCLQSNSRRNGGMSMIFHHYSHQIVSFVPSLLETPRCIGRWIRFDGRKRERKIEALTRKQKVMRLTKPKDIYKPLVKCNFGMTREKRKW